jgi:hypothetical protein
MFSLTASGTQLLGGAANTLLAWWDGGPAFVLASKGLVRLNFRGGHATAASVRADLAQAGWTTAPCNESATALCSAEYGRVMPDGTPCMADTAQGLADGWSALGCQHSDGKAMTGQQLYDISACDVLEGRLDLVFARGVLYFRPFANPLWEYWLLVLLAIVLVRSLSFNVQALWAVRTPVHDQRVALLASAVVLVLVSARGDGAFVTAEEQVFFWCSVAYVCMYLAVHCIEAFRRSSHREQLGPIFNLIVGSLLLVSQRWYSGVDSPYAQPLLAMLAVRGWLKLFLLTDDTLYWRPAAHDSGAKESLSWTHRVTLILDALYMSLYIQITHADTGLALVAILAAAFAAGELLVSGAVSD